MCCASHTPPQHIRAAALLNCCQVLPGLPPKPSIHLLLPLLLGEGLAVVAHHAQHAGVRKQYVLALL